MVRQKKRYFVIHVHTSENPKKKFKFWTLNQKILAKIQENYGDFGMAAIQGGFYAKYINQETQMAIIKAPHGPHKMVASVIATIKSLDGVKVQCETLYTGATVKNCFTFLIQYQQRKFDEFVVNLKTVEEIEELKKALQIDTKDIF